VTVKFLGDVKDLKKATEDADGALGKVGSAVGGMAKTAALVGVPALVGFGAAAVKAFAESEQVAAQTEAVLKSTGGAAKVTADHVGDLAGSLSMLSGVDDEVIQSGENVLLTFTNVRNAAGKNNDIFDQATKTALDMSVALGTDLQSANIQLGKALNDPIKGITALTRVGVSFTDAQKEQIKALVASGDVMGAQKIILKELQTEFGGSAKAAGDTFAGQIGKLKVAVGNFMEDVGQKLVPVLMRVGEILADVIPRALKAVAPLFDTLKVGVAALVAAFKEGDVTSDGFVGGMERVGNTLRTVWQFIQSSVVPVFQQVWDVLEHNLRPVLAAVAVVAGAVLYGALVSLAGTIAALLSPVVAIIGGLAALAAGLEYAYENSETFRNAVDTLWQAVQSAFDAIKVVVATAVDFLRGVWRVFGDDLKSFAREAWAGVAETFRGAFNTLSGIFDLIKAVFTGKWGDAWTAVKKIVDGAWDAIFGVVRNAVTNVIPTILAGLGQAISSVARTAFDGLKEPFKAVLNWMIDRINDFVKVALAPLALANKIPGLGSAIPDIPKIPHLAGGGTFSGAALVGEKGPELLVGAGRVIPNSQLGGITIIVQGALDPVAVGRQIQSILLEEKRRSGALGLA